MFGHSDGFQLLFIASHDFLGELGGGALLEVNPVHSVTSEVISSDDDLAL